MDAQFHREYLLRLPLPLAQLYSRAYNAKDARGRHDNCYYLFEVLIKLSACPLTACYVQGIRRGGPRVAKLDQLLLQLAFPSLGQWMAILRETARHYATLPDAASHPLGQIWGQLNHPHHDPSALAALYRRIKNGPDGQPSGDQSCTILQLFEALVQYRNGVIGHGAGRFESFYANDMGPLLFPAVNEVLAEGVFSPLGPSGARLAYLTELRAVSEERFELGMRELTGPQGERLAPLSLQADETAGLAPNRLAVLWPGRQAPLRLDPLVIFRESEMTDEVLLLNGERSGRQVEYLSYTTGRTERTKEMGTDLAAMLSILAGRKVTEAKLQELAAQSRAATPSVEVLTEPAGLVRRQLGDYEILAEIGRGGMGVVYKARNKALNREVALKVIAPAYAGNPRIVKRLHREAQAAAQMTHPNIVAIHNIGQVQQFHFIEMEYVAGETLRDIIDRQAPMPPSAALPLLKQIARAVAVAHSHRIIHHDIKPDNVIVTANGIVKVADFGLAKCLDEEGRGTTSTGTNLGSPLFMAPERFDGVKEDPRSDLYSIGVVAYLMLTRQYPCSGASVVEIMRSHKRIPPRPIRELNPGVPPALSAVVHKLLEKRLDNRFADAKSFLRALTAASAPSAGARGDRKVTVRTPMPPAAMPAEASAQAAGAHKGKTGKVATDDKILLKRFVIEFIAGPLEGHRIYISTTAPVTIGRGKDMDVQVDDPQLSKRHARLSVSAGRLKVEDLGSRHGVWLKGQRVSTAFVAPGDKLRMAKSLLRVVEPSVRPD